MGWCVYLHANEFSRALFMAIREGMKAPKKDIKKHPEG